ncbi:MAG: HEAT repeat domain-containing protein [bacterium]
MNDLLWWKSLEDGKEYLFSFLFIDRAKSTKDPKYYNEEQASKRAELFHKVVQNIANSFNGRCLEWHGDGNVIFFYTSDASNIFEKSNILSKKAVEAGLSIFQELILQKEEEFKEIKAYISINVGMLEFKKEMGRIKSRDLDITGHMLKVCPEAGILIHEEVYKILTDDLKEKFRYLGTTSEDFTPVFVYPRQREIPHNKINMFIPQDKDKYREKELFLNFIRDKYSKIIPRGFRQENLISVNLFDIYSPLKVRQRYEKEIADFSSIKDQKIIESINLPSDHPITLFKTVEKSAPINIQDVVKKNNHFIILGSPGSGKSTFIKWLALTCVAGKISSFYGIGILESLIPIPVSIGHLSEIWQDNNKNIGVLEAIKIYFSTLNYNISDFIDEELENGMVIFLFDGLDEVLSDIDRDDISLWLEDFVKRYSKNRFVITSRIVGFKGFFLQSDKIYLIENLVINEAKPIIKKWMTAIEYSLNGVNDVSRVNANDEADRLIKILEHKPQFEKFISNPFLLTLTVLLHRNEAELPNYRIQIFERMIQTLVETWQQARSLGGMSLRTLRMDFRTEAIPILSPLALWIHKNFPAGIVPEEEIKEFIKDKLNELGVSRNEIDKAVDNFFNKLRIGTGLLEEKGKGLWGFMHQSFQEYLCSIELVRDESYEANFRKYNYDPRWEEIFILVAGELGITQANTKKVSKFIEIIVQGINDPIKDKILKKNMLLAGKCLVSSANINIKLVERIINFYKENLFSSDINNLRKRLIDILCDMMNIKIVFENIRNEISSKLKIEEKKDFAINAIGHLGLKEEWAIEAIKRGLRDDSSWVRNSAIDAIGHLGLKEEWAIEALKSGLEDDNRWIRRYTIYAIGRLSIKEKWAIEAIKNGLQDADYLVRNSAIDAIGYFDLKEEWVIEAIKNRLRDRDRWIRQYTIYAIGRLNIKEEWAIEAIKEGLQNTDYLIRNSAIDAVGHLGIKEEWVIEAIKSGLKDDRVKRSAIDTIRRLDIKEEWVLNALVENFKEKDLKNYVYETLWELV